MKTILFTHKFMMLTCMAMLLSMKAFSYTTHTVYAANLKITVTDEMPNNAIVDGLKDPEFQGDITIPRQVDYAGVTHTIAQINSTAFQNATGLRKVDLSDTNIRIINPYVFQGCTNLVAVKLPSTISSIGKDAFANCPNLLAVHCAMATPPSMQNAIIELNNNRCTLYVPSESVGRYQGTNFWSYFSSIEAEIEEDYRLYINEANFPNRYFRETMLLETHVENDGNPYFTPQNIEDIRVLILQNSLITNVKGLEFLTYLQELYLPGTGISSFEISGLSQLVVLDISNTSISQLDLSHNHLIQQLHCNDCPNLPAIDLTNTPFVWELYCYNSNVSSITGLGELLEDLRCYNNPVSGVLDLSSSTRLKKLMCGSCSITELNISNCKQLQTLQCDNNQLTSLDVSNNPDLTRLFCNNNNLEFLTAASCNSLQVLHCHYNKLSRLELSGCPALNILKCEQNQLTELDLSDNPNIQYLTCTLNQLTSLDVSHLDDLRYLHCSGNRIKTLDLSHNTKLNTEPYENTMKPQDIVQSCDDTEIEILPNNKLAVALDQSLNDKINNIYVYQDAEYRTVEKEFIGNHLVIGTLGDTPENILYSTPTGNDVVPSMSVWLNLKEAPPTSVSITLAASAGTYCSAYPLDFTDSNLRAYIATGFGNNSVMMTRVYKVPARTALILKGTKNTPYTIPVSGCFSAYANLLVGLVERTDVQPTEGSYTNMSLGYGSNNVLGFYPFTNAGAIGPNRAYLQVPTYTLEQFPSGSAKYLRLQFDDENDSEATGINDANANGMTEGKWYNMQGVELPGIPTEKGIYIHNGKKVIVN